LLAQPARFDLNQFAGDGTSAYFVEITHASGLRHVHRIVANDIDTVLIDDDWYRPPSRGDQALIMIELDLPKVDLSKCIGCGLCENACPVVGSRRAVYVTAEGETRSQHHQDPHRNRSVQPVSRGT
jgi:MinD superfamily P-loop ATPase